MAFFMEYSVQEGVFRGVLSIVYPIYSDRLKSPYGYVEADNAIAQVSLGKTHRCRIVIRQPQSIT